MGYLGLTPTTAQQNYLNIDDISGSFNGTTTSFALQVGGVAPTPFPVTNSCLISVGGVIQQPDDTGTDGFRISGGNIIFSSAPGTGEDFFGLVLAGADYLNVGANFPDGTVGTPSITFESDLNTGIYHPSADSIAITSGGTAALTVDSNQRVGVGTSSPDYKLHVSGANAEIGLTDTNVTDATWRLLAQTGNSTKLFRIYDNSNAADRFVINAAGNVGIGTTSPGALLDVQLGATGTIAEFRGDGTDLLHIDGDSDQITFDARNVSALAFEMQGSEAARIDSSRRLLVGTTSAVDSALVQFAGAKTFTGGIPQNQLNINDTTAYADGVGGAIAFSGKYHSAGFNTTFGSVEGVKTNATNGDYGGRLVFKTRTNGSNNTERVRITNLGRFKASNTGSYYGATNSEHELVNDATGVWVARASHTATSGPYGIIVHYANTTPNATSSQFFYALDSTAVRFEVRSNGGIGNYQANNANLCDEREKKNIEALDSTWGCLKNWELKKFHYNEDADTDDKRYGVIAQQVAEHCPEVITDWVKQKAEDAVLDEDGNVVTPAKEEVVRMGVKEQQMYWMAIKALQEAQTRIETLETANASQAATIAALDARLTALEGA